MKIDEHGYITNWLISGPKEELFTMDIPADNQLNYEKKLRGFIADNKEVIIPEDIKLGENSFLKKPWTYYHSKGNWFVDVSAFYSLTTKVEMLAAVYIHAEEATIQDATLWTYASIDLHLNNELICQTADPVYKPIIKKDVKLTLKKGQNFIAIRMQNLGVRDTRNQFGLQLQGDTTTLTTVLPDEEQTKEFTELDNWLAAINMEKGRLILPSKAPCKVTLVAGDETLQLNDTLEIDLKKYWETIEINGSIENETLKRKIDIVEHINASSLNNSSDLDNKKDVYNKISQVESEFRMKDVYFCVLNILAKCGENGFQESDRDNLLNNLDLIDSRIDCADFLITALVRLVKNYELGDEINARIKEVLLNFRYWMDGDGADGMCFWSENHALMFYSAAFFAGEFYPDEIFPRAGQKGAELQATAKERCIQWLDDIIKDGFEEFNSAGYMVVTFGALMNLVDYCEDDISLKAIKVADTLLEQLALHTFNGSVIGPQGRVYRDVVMPFTQGVQALINLADYTAPYKFQDWLALLITSKYKFPNKLKEAMVNPVDVRYKTGNAIVKLKKTSDYIITSVESEYNQEDQRVWDNISFSKDLRGNYHYVKSLNERFHGTTYFQPGVYGYQQHMWSAALANDCVVFVNHPGGTFDGSGMRPGYWYGNGIMPAVKQEGSVLGTIYSIPEHHPIHFTHAFWPEVKFDESKQDGNWRFAKKGEGFTAMWCSTELKKHNDQMFNCELRSYSSNTAYVVRCSSVTESGSFDSFIKECKSSTPVFDKENLTLTVDSSFGLVFKKAEDKTQYI